MARKIEIKTDQKGDYLEFRDGPHVATIIFERGRFIFGAPIDTFNVKEQ